MSVPKIEYSKNESQAKEDLLSESIQKNVRPDTNTSDETLPGHASKNPSMDGKHKVTKTAKSKRMATKRQSIVGKQKQLRHGKSAVTKQRLAKRNKAIPTKRKIREKKEKISAINPKKFKKTIPKIVNKRNKYVKGKSATQKKHLNNFSNISTESTSQIKIPKTHQSSSQEHNFILKNSNDHVSKYLAPTSHPQDEPLNKRKSSNTKGEIVVKNKNLSKLAKNALKSVKTKNRKNLQRDKSLHQKKREVQYINFITRNSHRSRSPVILASDNDDENNSKSSLKKRKKDFRPANDSDELNQNNFRKTNLLDQATMASEILLAETLSPSDGIKNDSVQQQRNTIPRQSSPENSLLYLSQRFCCDENETNQYLPPMNDVHNESNYNEVIAIQDRSNSAKKTLLPSSPVAIHADIQKIKYPKTPMPKRSRKAGVSDKKNENSGNVYKHKNKTRKYAKRETENKKIKKMYSKKK